MDVTYPPDIEALLGSSALTRPMAMLGGAYDGAGRFDKAIALWQPPLQSADQDILPEKSMADSRVRDTIRNDAYVMGGANLHRDNIVGGTFLLNAKPATKVLRLDETWETEFQEEVEAKFTLWAESPDHWPDAARKNTLTGLVRLAVGINVAAGEVLASAEWLRDQPRPYNTAIQMVDLDRLSTPPDHMDNPRINGGVESDTYGAPQAFHVRKAHPSEWNDPNNWLWKRVPIRKPWGRLQMLHIMEQTRPDQTRGISEIVAGLKELRITKKFRDVVLQNAVINATYAASIESELPSEVAFASLGGGNMGEMGSAVANYATQYLGAISEYSGSARNMQIDGVKIPHLFPGTKLQLRPAGQGGPLGTDFEQSLLRYVAALLGVSYEQLSRDYTQTNYSSARAAGNETWKFMQARKRMVADRFATMVYRLWLEEAINKGQITSMPKAGPSWYDGLNGDAYSSCDWIGASRGQIDELKETQAAVLRMNNNLTTAEYELGRLGMDYRQVYRQNKREKDLREDLGIEKAPVAGAKNMMNGASGTPRNKSAGAAAHAA